MENKIKIPESVYDWLQVEALRLNVSISEVCRRANIDRSIVERWKGSNPKSVDTVRTLQAVMIDIESEQTLANGNAATVSE